MLAKNYRRSRLLQLKRSRAVAFTDKEPGKVLAKVYVASMFLFSLAVLILEKLW